MKKILDALLGRTFKASKFLHVGSLAMTCIASKKDQHQAQCSQAQSAVVLLLKHGYHNRALLRVERIINELRMLDALNMIEGYLNLLIERVNLIEKEREFATCAIELRLNCRVNPKMILLLSTRQPILKCRMKLLNDIASDNNIALQLENAVSISTEENLDVNKKQNQPGDSWGIVREKIKNDDMFTRKSRDVTHAPEVAFEPATCAHLTNIRERPISVGTRQVGVQ
ncbi:uncharacterized protein LOC132173665 [Corylus avellana]|uniref:uncharacterized protein LOC132173665 n=1 Tax=Corylus avellana TaxID=13451 RepID=UPI00286AF571|nr:uncharacterized protein LOC132173665 [Corylus avellana]